MSGITIVHKNYDENFDANIKFLIDMVKDNHKPDILVLPNMFFGPEDISLDIINARLNNISKSPIIFFGIKNNTYVYDGKITRTNTFIFDGNLFNLVTDERDIKNNCYLNILLCNKPFGIKNINEDTHQNTLAISISGVIGDYIFDGRGYICKDKTYHLQRWNELSQHFSWRQINNIQNLDYSRSSYGETYKALVYGLRYFDATFILEDDIKSLLLFGVAKDSFKSPDIFKNKSSENIEWMASKYGINIPVTNNQQTYPLKLFDAINDIDDIKNLISWRNKLSDLDIKGFNFDGIVHPFPEEGK